MNIFRSNTFNLYHNHKLTHSSLECLHRPTLYSDEFGRQETSIVPRVSADSSMSQSVAPKSCTVKQYIPFKLMKNLESKDQNSKFMI